MSGPTRFEMGGPSSSIAVSPARIKRIKNGNYLAHCAQCDEPLGLANRPNATGVAVPYLEARTHAVRDGREGPKREDWYLTPPRNKDDRIGGGFRHERDGETEVVHLLIRRLGRDEFGRVKLGADGQPLRRFGGRTPGPRDFMSPYEMAHNPKGFFLMGHYPPLPVVIECHQCHRRNLVEAPTDEDVQSQS